MFSRALNDVVRLYRRSWWYLALVQLASGIVVALPVALVAQAANLVVGPQGEALTATADLRTFAVVLLAASIAVCLPLALVGLSATVRTTNDSLAGRARRFRAAFAEGFHRIPALALAAVITIGGTVLLAVLSPILTVLGLLALALTPVVRLVRRRREGFLCSWPDLVALAWVIAPLGLALRFLAGAMFFAPAIVLEGLGPIAALRAGADAASPRRLRLVGFVVVGVVLTAALQTAASWLGSFIHVAAGSLAGQVLVQLFFVALPVIAVTVLFRLARSTGRDGSLPASRTEAYTTGVTLAPRRRLVLTEAPGIVRRVATLMPFVVVIAGVGMAPTAASAAPLPVQAAGLSLTVTTGADTTDEAVIAAQGANCTSGSGDCSLRAAVRVAQTESDLGTYDSVVIGFDGSYTIAITPGSPISFVGLAGSAGGGGEGGEGGEGGLPGRLTIDGGNHTIVLDGQGASQVLYFHHNSWSLQLHALQISRGVGVDELGGGLYLGGTGQSYIDSVTFDDNFAGTGGAAVFVQGGQLSITNSTFSGNSIGSTHALDFNGGGDVYSAFGNATSINNSTFVDYDRGSLFAWSSTGSSISVSNSLFDVRNGNTLQACSGGGYTGSSNVVSGADTSCPDTIPNPGPSVGALQVLAVGGPAVMPLIPSADNAAIASVGGRGIECLAYDQRGMARAAVGCDAGALANDPTTTTTLASSLVAPVVGADLTLTATVALVDGAAVVETGAVSFAIDGIEVLPAVAVAGGAASLVVDSLHAGIHTVVATYAPADPARIAGSVSGVFSQEVAKSGSTVTLVSSLNPALTTDPITATATVTAQDPDVIPGGTVALVDVSAGEPGVAVGTATTLVNGVADFDISSLAPGRHSLVARYSGDDDNTAAPSAVLQQLVRVTSTLDLDAETTDLDFGRDAQITVTVPAVGSAGVPTGQVTLHWFGGTRVLTLDSTGSAATALTDLPVGPSDVTASYSGDDRYTDSAATDLEMTVSPAATSTTLAVTNSTLDFGVPVTLTATVARTDGAAPVGTVTFFSGATELQTVTVTRGTGATSSAAYSPAAGELPVGTRSITAVFASPGGYTGSTSAAATLTVGKAGARISVTSDTSPAPVSTPVTLTASAVGTGGSVAAPDGTVEFFDGTSSLGTAALVGGVATLVTTFTTRGAHSITASYPGSASFTAHDSAVFAQSIVTETATTVLTVTPGGLTHFGTTLLLTVGVTGVTSGTPGVGSVVIRDGSTIVATIELVDGEGSEHLASPTAGEHSYQGTFVPATADFAGGTSNVVIHTVDAAATTTVLALSKTSSVHNDPVTLTATVTATDAAPAGSVAFTTGDTVLGTVAVVAATATSSVATLTAGIPQSVSFPQGVRDVVATFTPSGDFSGSTSAVPFAVTRGTTSLDFVLVGSTAGDAQSLVATVTTLTGSGHPSGTVTFSGVRGASGAATLVDGVATLTGITLPAGAHAIQAAYSSLDGGFSEPDPSSVLKTLTVTAGTPTVTVVGDATGSTGYGDAVTLTATVGTTGIAPTGSVRFTASGPSGTLVLGTVSVDGSGAAALTTRAIPVGTQSITAEYLGDNNWTAVTSAALTQIVTATATATALTASPSPSLRLGEITLRAEVTAAGTTPTAGTVEFRRGSTVLATVAVNGSGVATYRYTPPAIGTETLEARYSSASGDFGASSGTATHTIEGNPVFVTLSDAGGSVPVGQSRTLSVELLYTLSTRPTGAVTISDGAGTSCTAALSPTGSPGVLGGTCAVSWSSAGDHVLTASYAGDSLYAGDTSRQVHLSATTRDTGLSITSSNRWIKGETATLTWSVVGPTTPGSLVHLYDSTGTICTSTQLSGTCTYTIPERTEANIVMVYSGTAEWAAKSTLFSKPITTCVRAVPYSASPTEGTVSVLTAPNCGATGYLPDTVVRFLAVPAAGFTFLHWDDPDQTNPIVEMVATGEVVVAHAYFEQPCVSVTLSAPAGTQRGGSEILSFARPGCGSEWTSDDHSRTALFEVGSVIDLRVFVPDKPTWRLYGWSGLAAGADTTAIIQSYTVTAARTQRIVANFGVTCAHDVRVVQPAGGTVTIGGPNCTDDRGAGYTQGSIIPVTAKSTGEPYFQNWEGNTTALTSTATTATATVRVYATNPPVSARFGTCVSFSVAGAGYSFLGNGDVSLNTTSVKSDLAGNCPTKGNGWYTPGTRLYLSTTGEYGTAFKGWTTNAEWWGSPTSPNSSVVVRESGTAEAFWYSKFQCVPFSVTSMQPGLLTVSADLHGEVSCPAGMFNVNAGGTSGVWTTLTAKATSGNPLIGWTGTTKKFVSRDLAVPSVMSPTTVNPLDVYISGRGTAYQAWACQQILTSLTLVSPNGTKHTGPVPSGSNFVAASPAPDCPLATSAYTIGQDVFPQALGETAGYTFVGWSGAVTGTEAFSTTPIAIDGASKGVELTATYRVNCFTLTTNKQHTAVETAPNCPDTDAAENKYIGGTTITLQTIGNAGTKVFRGFTGDVDGQSGIYSWVTIEKDSAIYSNYETRGAGEAIRDALSDFGNGTAILAKKAVGVVAAVASAFVMGNNPVLMLASLVVLLGTGVQAVADAFGLKSEGLSNFTGGVTALSQMLTFMQAGATCATVWSASSGDKVNAGTTNTSISGAAGTVIANRIIEVRDKAAAVREAQRAAQSAAMAAAYDARATNLLLSQSDEALSASTRAANYVKSTVTSATAKVDKVLDAVKGPLETVGRLGDAAMVGYMVYSEYQNENTGWDSSASAAWTTGGDVYMDCLMNSVPPYFGLPKHK